MFRFRSWPPHETALMAQRNSSQFLSCILLFHNKTHETTGHQDWMKFITGDVWSELSHYCPIFSSFHFLHWWCLTFWKLVNVIMRKFVSTNWTRRLLAHRHVLSHSVMNQTHHLAGLCGCLLPYYSSIICSQSRPSIFFFWQHILSPVQCWAIITGLMCQQRWKYLSGIISKNIKMVV